MTLYGDEQDEPFLVGFWDFCQSIQQENLVSPGSAAVFAMGLIRLFSNPDTIKQSCLGLMKLTKGVRKHIFDCLKIFASSPWWNRIWVIQEVVVNTAVIVQHGTVTATWEILARVAHAWSLPETRNQVEQTGLEPENLRVLALFRSHVSSLERIRRRWRIEGGTPLLRLLQEFSDRQASDDRDKVYGLLGLTNQEYQIRPDYMCNVFETYRITVLTLIREENSLACWAGDQQNRRESLPWWVPDWSFALDPGDKRRAELPNGYNANQGWTLQIIDNESDYWAAVVKQMRQLVDCPAAQYRNLPASLCPSLLHYIECLDLRAKLVAFKEFTLRLPSSVGELLQLCVDEDIDISSSWPLWIVDEDKQSRIWGKSFAALPLDDLPHDVVHQLESLREVVQNQTGDTEDSKEAAKSSILKIHSLFFDSQGERPVWYECFDKHILSDEQRHIKSAITDLIDQCQRLLPLCSEYLSCLTPSGSWDSWLGFIPLLYMSKRRKEKRGKETGICGTHWRYFFTD